MELLSQHEINLIAKKCGYTTVLNWKFEDLTDKCIVYRGDNLKLIIVVSKDGITSILNLFVKCMPRTDKWKSAYLKEIGFFNKEYAIMSTLFKEFEDYSGAPEWRPTSLFIKENIFVFEDVSLLGYKMPNHQDTMTFEEIKACVETLAVFHAESLNYESYRSCSLTGKYSIWSEYSHNLQEPSSVQDWRDTGRNAVIEYLKVFSKYKSKHNFNSCVHSILPTLFDRAKDLMKPSSNFYSVVTHCDLWANNIFIKKEENSQGNKKLETTGNSQRIKRALFANYQTVIYSSPMLDLSSLIYFNTRRSDRDNWTNVLLDAYYDILSCNVEDDLPEMIDKSELREEYKKSIVFGLTQAAIITPIVAMSKEKSKQIFCNPESSRRANVVTRSQEIIDIAKEDEKYQARITELFDEIVERYVFPNDFGIIF